MSIGASAFLVSLLLIASVRGAAAQTDVVVFVGVPAILGAPLPGTLDATGNPVELKQRRGSLPLALGLRYSRGVASGRLRMEASFATRSVRVRVNNTRPSDPFYQAGGDGQISVASARLVLVTKPQLFVAVGPGIVWRWGDGYTGFSGKLSPAASVSAGVLLRVRRVRLRVEVEDIVAPVKLSSPDATFERRVQHMLMASVGVTVWRLP